MQLVNGAKILNITFLLVLFTAAPAAAVFGSAAVPLTIYNASVESHKFYLVMDILNLMSLLSYVPFDSSFTSIQILVLSFDGWFVVSSERFDIPLLYYDYYINLSSILDHQ